MLESLRAAQRAASLLVDRAASARRSPPGRCAWSRASPQLDQFQPGEVLVADKTDPDWEPVMRRPPRSSPTGRAHLPRRHRVPRVRPPRDRGDGARAPPACGRRARSPSAAPRARRASSIAGALPFARRAHRRCRRSPRPRTQMMLNVGNPEQAFALAVLPNDGVGLARDGVHHHEPHQVHPMALARIPTQLDDAESRGEIAGSPRGYDDKPRVLRRPAGEGVATIAAAFYPKPVIVRLERLQDQRVRRLLGGARVRAGGREPDARLPRRVALLRRALPRRLRARVPRR